LGAGVLLAAFSRSLTLLVGLGIVVWQVSIQYLYAREIQAGTDNVWPQYAARKGYNFIPVERMQRYVKNVDLRSAVNDNIAFKVSFGLMFALAAFGEF
jgi:hypothetical protein